MWDRLAHSSRLSADPGDIPLAAVLVPLYEDPAGDIRVVLTKRPDTMPTHAGHIAFPGGRPDPGDAGRSRHCPARGIGRGWDHPSRRVEVLGFLPAIHTFEFSLLVVPVVGRLPGIPHLQPSEREVARVFVPRLVDLADHDSWRSEPWGERLVWFYELEGDILWGATAHMMRNLLGMTP